MATGRARSPADFARNYDIDTTGTYGERASKFLNEGANVLPYRFFDKRLLAKVAFGLSRVPGEDTDYVKKRLGSVLTSANRLLMKVYSREVYVDPVEGIRATVDDADLVRTKHRRKRRRVKTTIASLQATDNLVDSNKLTGDLKRELMRSRRSIKSLNEAVGDLPQLPSAKGRGEPSES